MCERVMRAGIVPLLLLLLLLVAAAEACPWSCPNGVKAVPNPGYNATTNGCGPTGLVVSTQWEFTPCCDKHDICYQRCGKSKKTCDEAFLACLNRVCKALPTEQAKCKQTASLFGMATTTFGCSSYQESQSAACLCDALSSSSDIHS